MRTLRDDIGIVKLLIGSVLFAAYSFGQVAISGSALDSVTGKPVSNVEIALKGILGAKPKNYTAAASADPEFTAAGYPSLLP